MDRLAQKINESKMEELKLQEEKMKKQDSYLEHLQTYIKKEEVRLTNDIVKPIDEKVNHSY